MDFSLSDEQQRLVETARKFTREQIIPVAQKLDEHGTFPKEICEHAWEIGLMNVEVPQEVGGLGLSTLDHVLMAEEVNYGCAGIGTTMFGNNLAAMPIILAGTRSSRRSGWACSPMPPSSPPTPAPSRTRAATWPGCAPPCARWAMTT